MPKNELSSMTGYAADQGTLLNAPIRLEIKSLNSRFLDVKVRVPRELNAIELLIRDELKRHFSRGTIDLRIDFNDKTDPNNSASSDQDQVKYQTNLSLAAHYFESLNSLQKTLGLSDPIKTADILSFPDVIARKNVSESLVGLETNEIWSGLQPIIQSLVQKLKQMRLNEGSHLLNDIQTKMNSIHQKIEKLKARRNESRSEIQNRLGEKITKIFQAYPIESQATETLLNTRLSQEISILVERSDIEEELTRLEGHIDHFKQTLSSGGSIGKKLEFILQEMGREVNTLGSKAQDFLISEQVVNLKVELEQVREQIMNVE